MNILLFLLCYVIGSLPFSFLVGKYIYHLDLRKVGSGNLGTTNAFRATGFKGAALVFIFDLLKCTIPMLLIQKNFSLNVALISGIFVCIGHCYSIFLKFKGGKAVASTGGYVLALDYRIFLILLVIQFGVLFLSKKMSIASLVNAVAVPTTILLFYGVGSKFYGGLFLGAFVFFTHRENIKRLLKGEEKNLI